MADSDDDDDDLLLLQALVKMLNSTAHNDAVPRLLDTESSQPRFFQSIYTSPNAFLFRDHFRMDRDAFDALYDSFKFKMAFSTIHRYRRIGLHAVIKTLSHSIDMPRTVSTWFAEAFPYFDQAVGAINGVHIPVVVATQGGERFRNRKGWPYTNVLIASDREMNIGFIYPGAEGAAHDSMVLVRSELLREVRQHHYVISDAGYALQPQALTPYREVQYHLKEWAPESGRHKTAKELYNLRHAKARNVVERVNGILKRRFKILRVPIEFEFMVAKAVVFASPCLHNFIRQHNADDHAVDLSDEEDSQEDRNEGDDERCADAIDVFPFDFSSASNWRDWMAAAMWDEYQGFQR
ncbi:unnamed protein product [Phytophthora fragariaefolia]|uniref:Unnamed protein product n=1 Tax=Phytophthora fragariaefolia TaxID=1490495 RepID=A0A9W7CWM1_9STRA|nr:unnamed protein product [Phytophthora fragariaefolia]